ncbi:MAG: hypothetical protein R3C01_15170 [Planctomycetaceae bacterium]
MVASRVSASRWEDECASVRLWLGTRPASISTDIAEQMLKTIDAPLPKGATPVVIVHCYADVPAGTEYHVAFDPEDPNTNEFTHAEVLFGVVMGRFVDMTLSHGWHQTAVLYFPAGMPKLFNQLSVDQISSRYLCLCSQSDFHEIKRARTNLA